jgi:hypothetical protein
MKIIPKSLYPFLTRSPLPVLWRLSSFAAAPSTYSGYVHQKCGPQGVSNIRSVLSHRSGIAISLQLAISSHRYEPHRLAFCLCARILGRSKSQVYKAKLGWRVMLPPMRSESPSRRSQYILYVHIRNSHRRVPHLSFASRILVGYR